MHHGHVLKTHPPSSPSESPGGARLRVPDLSSSCPFDFEPTPAAEPREIPVKTSATIRTLLTFSLTGQEGTALCSPGA